MFDTSALFSLLCERSASVEHVVTGVWKHESLPLEGDATNEACEHRAARCALPRRPGAQHQILQGAFYKPSNSGALHTVHGTNTMQTESHLHGPPAPQDHEWVKVTDGIATVGITNHAQEQLGDVVFVELPELGSTVEQNDTMGAVESVKAASDIYSPLSGVPLGGNMNISKSPSRWRVLDYSVLCSFQGKLVRGSAD